MSQRLPIFPPLPLKKMPAVESEQAKVAAAEPEPCHYLALDFLAPAIW